MSQTVGSELVSVTGSPDDAVDAVVTVVGVLVVKFEKVVDQVIV
jgi:hypothetical protein